MSDDRLINYVKNQISRGVPPETIKGALRQAGWGEAQIEEAFEVISQPSGTKVHFFEKYAAFIGWGGIVIAVLFGILFGHVRGLKLSFLSSEVSEKVLYFLFLSAALFVQFWVAVFFAKVLKGQKRNLTKALAFVGFGSLLYILSSIIFSLSFSLFLKFILFLLFLAIFLFFLTKLYLISWFRSFFLWFFVSIFTGVIILAVGLVFGLGFLLQLYNAIKPSLSAQSNAIVSDFKDCGVVKEPLIIDYSLNYSETLAKLNNDTKKSLGCYADLLENCKKGVLTYQGDDLKEEISPQGDECIITFTPAATASQEKVTCHFSKAMPRKVFSTIEADKEIQSLSEDLKAAAKAIIFKLTFKLIGGEKSEGRERFLDSFTIGEYAVRCESNLNSGLGKTLNPQNNTSVSSDSGVSIDEQALKIAQNVVLKDLKSASNLECLNFSADKNNEFVVYSVNRKFNDVCGGDPTSAPTIPKIKIILETKEILIQSLDGEFRSL